MYLDLSKYAHCTWDRINTSVARAVLQQDVESNINILTESPDAWASVLSYIGHILGISEACLRHIMGTSWAYFRHI